MFLELGRPSHLFGGNFALIGRLLLLLVSPPLWLPSCFDASGRFLKRCGSSLRLRRRPLCGIVVRQSSRVFALIYFRPRLTFGTRGSPGLFQSWCRRLPCLMVRALLIGGLSPSRGTVRQLALGLAILMAMLAEGPSLTLVDGICCSQCGTDLFWDGIRVFSQHRPRPLWRSYGQALLDVCMRSLCQHSGIGRRSPNFF